MRATFHFVRLSWLILVFWLVGLNFNPRERLGCPMVLSPNARGKGALRHEMAMKIKY
jgi:hypothetical protein